LVLTKAFSFNASAGFMKLTFHAGPSNGREPCVHTHTYMKHKPVAYLCNVAPVAKFKCEPFLIIQILDVGTIFTKNKSWRK